MVAIMTRETVWECDACLLRHKTHEQRPHVPMHPCRARAGLLSPFVEVGSPKVNIRVVERDDYVGDAVVTYAGGRAIQAVDLERADGSNDRWAFADCAVARTSYT